MNKWEERLDTEAILCWVWDYGPENNPRDEARMITEKMPQVDKPYTDHDGEWVYATPVKASELYRGEI